MSDTAPDWVVPAKRAGHAARGLVYTLVGGFALYAAIAGGRAQGTESAISEIGQSGWSVALLWIIALGLFAYAAWRWIDAWMDLEDHGTDGKGLVARGGLVVTGLIHAVLGVSVARIALGAASGGGGGGGTQTMTQKLMQLPYGQWLVGLAALCVIGAGIYYVQKGLRGKYREDIRITPVTRTLDPVLKAGFVAQGIVVGIIGLLILYAALSADPSQAGGVGEALSQIRQASYGGILFFLISLGLLAFALENYVEAIYGFVPRHAGPDIRTLAERARDKTEEIAS